MEKTRSTGLWALSAAIFSLALALGYFAWEVRQFLTGFPEILIQMEKTSVAIAPVTRDIAETTGNIDPIAEKVEHVAEFIPAVLEEVRATRQSLPEVLMQVRGVLEKIQQTLDQSGPLLQEIQKNRAAIPEVLAEIRGSRETVEKAMKSLDRIEARIPEVIAASDRIRADLPETIQTIDKASDTVSGFTAEVGEVRKTMPIVLEEMKKTRESLPPLLDQAERIASKGGKFGSDAGKGVVTGLISLINPISLTMQLKDLVLPGKDIRGLAAEDIDKIREITLTLVESGEEGMVLDWNNPASRNQGKVSVIRRFTEGAVDCKEIRTEIWIQGDKSHDFKAVFCRQPDGAWIKK
ncbi:MAG: hypothetical protein COX19_17710 [Desulfobacterales bacterium CG23_combo_of_CG06-09_8_20_14_all_51_8]|nr:MAG: hypothetical protein COX19_17710 [Desulfobacterales bacterium CG23_combo_of_CG06-09_8_20_14_all_51_8]